MAGTGPLAGSQQRINRRLAGLRRVDRRKAAVDAFMLVVCVLYAAGTAVQIFRESLLREAHSTMTLDAPLRAGFLSFFAAPFVDLSKSAASWGARVVFSQLNSERPK